MASAGHPFFCDAAEHFIGDSGATGEPVYAGIRGAPGRIDGHRRKARFHGPRALAFDGATDTLFVADTGNAAVRCVDVRDGVVNTLLTFHDVRPLARVQEFTPSGIACDGERLAIVDIRNHVVWCYQLRTHTLTLLAGRPGSAGFQDGPCEQARFWLPQAIAVADRGGFIVKEARGQRLITPAGVITLSRA